MTELTTRQNADFSTALMWLKLGGRVARTGWNGKNMWLRYVQVDQARAIVMGTSFEPNPMDYAAHIIMKTADNKYVPWLASQTDLLAEDWWALPVAELKPMSST